MNRLIALALLLTCGSVQAATLVSVGTFATGNDNTSYSYSDGDQDVDYASNNLLINDIPVFGLSQFDPSLGTLTYTYSPVPAPAAVWLLGAGAIALAARARRRKAA